MKIPVLRMDLPERLVLEHLLVVGKTDPLLGTVALPLGEAGEEVHRHRIQDERGQQYQSGARNAYGAAPSDSRPR
jgi:hypothetical protein